jgi:hypothetical protein
MIQKSGLEDLAGGLKKTQSFFPTPIILPPYPRAITTFIALIDHIIEVRSFSYLFAWATWVGLSTSGVKHLLFRFNAFFFLPPFPLKLALRCSVTIAHYLLFR